MNVDLRKDPRIHQFYLETVWHSTTDLLRIAPLAANSLCFRS